MQALYWNGQKLKLNQSYPSPKADDMTALVRVRLAGICSTDLQIFKGYMGFHGVPGHEFVGEVKEGPEQLVGKRVAGEINFACGRCEYCGRGRGGHCPDRKVMGILGADGAFAEFLSIPNSNLHIVPEDVSDEEAVFTEPLAAAFEILEQTQIDPGDDVLVLGDGRLGFLCAQVLKFTGAHVTVLGKHAKKLSLIHRFSVRTLLLDDWKPRLFDIVVEATGSDSGFQLALSATRPRGVLVLKSTIAGVYQISLAPLVINEIKVVGSRCGPFPDALMALEEKSVSVTPLIDKVYPLKEGLEAVKHAAKPGTRKILLRP
ncbi:MAG: alcohol dehydrogenase catalytic domain-containing protein [Candidatus Binatia bacterium]